MEGSAPTLARQRAVCNTRVSGKRAWFKVNLQLSLCLSAPAQKKAAPHFVDLIRPFLSHRAK